ncbi:hypothetical protein C6Q22_29560 [Burkholderia multivorans]|nr:hypothetical protein WK22_22695 [Burkholderia multivorans]PRF18117.1 hypothetical protein C6Q03_27180 [Burkholderia multivorans]PRF78578.1 hypothetical protein C6Q22_29560 [Burkholderia multivorans]PRG65937.1 hypothetical protein C6T69_20705 [Burkholderia multivorans]PRH22604.1 hypothetical protein C6T56_07040 [Burkholderia multivorans]
MSSGTGRFVEAVRCGDAVPKVDETKLHAMQRLSLLDCRQAARGVVRHASRDSGAQRGRARIAAASGCGVDMSTARCNTDRGPS